MRKAMIVVLFVFTICSAAQAKQVYNAMENRWETVPDTSNWIPRYNAMENNWSYQPRRATTQYNPFNNQWEWDSGHNENTGDENN